MALAIGSLLWTAARGAGYGIVGHFGGRLLLDGTLPENRNDNNPLKGFNKMAVSAVAGAALALISLAFGTLPMLGMVLGAGLFYFIKGHSLASSDTDHGAQKAVEGTVGAAIISFVAFAILLNVAPELAMVI